jgi:filamentous hemagglutinin family protein
VREILKKCRMRVFFHPLGKYIDLLGHRVIKKQAFIIHALIFIFLPARLYALPQGGTVVGGDAAPFDYAGDTLTVTQTSSRLVTDWENFSIGQRESVIFQQPDVSSIALNRVTGSDPSRIFGALSSNGQIFLINPNGILFGFNAKVDTAGLLASTLDLDMTVEEFMAGHNRFTFAGPGGAVVNYGHIALNKPGGYAALLGSSVKNAGLIEANLGRVILAGGEEMTVDLDPAGLISVAVDVEKATGRNDNGAYAAVHNTGKIVADGGTVILSADILDGLFTSAVNNDGVIEADSLESGEGFVLLQSNQNIELNGTIKAGGAVDAQAGRNIILGRPVDDTTLSTFSWEYLSGERSYRFKEFGYFYGDGGTRVALSSGEDIGKNSLAPRLGEGVFETSLGEPRGLYTVFDSSREILTYFEDPLLNLDGLGHVRVNGTQYAWEDILNLGDRDFNDAVIGFTRDTTIIEAPGVFLSAPDIFLTAVKGSIVQYSGDIAADRLALSANTGIGGAGLNAGINVRAGRLSALNKSDGHLRVDNNGTLAVTDLSGVDGLNTGVTGGDGITNDALGGEVTVHVAGGAGADLSVGAPVNSRGPVTLTAQGDIVHADLGDVTVHNAASAPKPPQFLSSPSHEVGASSEDRAVEVIWELPDSQAGYGVTAQAGGVYTMAGEARISSQGGDVRLSASGDVSLSLIDAQNGNVAVTSRSGSILDADLSTAPADYDVVGHNIQLSADQGTVGGGADQEEIDLGHPYEFSYLWDNAAVSDPDLPVDPYEAFFHQETGDWSFKTVSGPLADGAWWFHAATLEGTPGPTAASETASLGPFHFISSVSTAAPAVFRGGIEDGLRVYYEILSPSKFLSFEPATKIGLYAYHPLTPTDYTAFDDITLDEDAYEFIDDNIRMKGPSAPYFGL